MSFETEARFFWGLLPAGRPPARVLDADALAFFGTPNRTRLLHAAFRRVRDVSVPYYATKYPRLLSFWERSFRLGVGRFLAPSVYFVASDGIETPGL